jgi:hypothetical protein
MQPITILGALLCFGVLYLRYRSQPKHGPRRTAKQKLKTAKILAGALLALMGIGYSLQRLDNNLDGTEHKSTLMERMVLLFSK